MVKGRIQPRLGGSVFRCAFKRLLPSPLCEFAKAIQKQFDLFFVQVAQTIMFANFTLLEGDNRLCCGLGE
jgi:hypothetical protein